jgi:hypothetical protein
MSGGSWNYVFCKIEDAAFELKRSECLYRRILGNQMELISKAMHDIEWVDSCDYSKGDEMKALKEAIEFDAARVGVEILHENLDTIIDQAQELKEQLKPTPEGSE